MKAKIIIAAMIMLLCATTLALADGNFHGTIKYTDCDCDLSDLVKIVPTAGGTAQYFNVWACGGNPGYSTYTTTFPPGWYNIVVIPHRGSSCDHGFIQNVYHGSEDQTVNLIVIGPSGDPDGGGE